MDDHNRPLTAKQKRFCDEYMIDVNGKQAAIRPGYSEHTAEQQGSRLLSNAKVFAEIQRRISERAKRVEVDADYVVEKLRTMVEDPNCPASSRVAALGLLARHLGMLTDKIDINDQSEQIRIVLESPTPVSSQLSRENTKLSLPEAKAQARLDEQSNQNASHAPGDSTGHHEGSKS